MLTPWQSCPEYTLLAGVKLTGTKRTPRIDRAFKYLARSRPLIQGAPTRSKGASVPALPTLWFPRVTPHPGTVSLVSGSADSATDSPSSGPWSRTSLHAANHPWEQL